MTPFDHRKIASEPLTVRCSIMRSVLHQHHFMEPGWSAERAIAFVRVGRSRRNARNNASAHTQVSASTSDVMQCDNWTLFLQCCLLIQQRQDRVFARSVRCYAWQPPWHPTVSCLRALGRRAAVPACSSCIQEQRHSARTAQSISSLGSDAQGPQTYAEHACTLVPGTVAWGWGVGHVKLS